VIPRGFRTKLERLGVSHVLVAYHWHEDEHRFHIEARDASGAPVPLDATTEWQTREALDAQDLSYGPYLLDVPSGTLVPYGRIEYLDGDSLGGTVAYAFDGDERAALLAGTWTPEQPAELARELSRHADVNARLALASNPSVSADVIRPLLGDLDDEVRWRAGQHPNVLPGFKREYARDLADAQDPAALPRDLERLARSDFATVRVAVAGNPSTPTRLLTDFARATAWPYLLAVATNPSTPAEARGRALDTLGRLPDPHERRVLAGHARTPWELLRRWTTDRDEFLRYRVARHPNTPTDAVMAFVNDPAAGVRSAARERLLGDPAGDAWNAASDHAPGSTTDSRRLREQWAAATTLDIGNDDFILAQDPDLAPEILAYFVTHPDKCAHVAGRADLSHEQMRMIAHSGNAWARHELAGNPRLPDDLAEELASDPDTGVRQALARRPRLPARAQDRLASDPDGQVRSGLAASEALTEGVMERLSHDEPWVATALLRNSALPEHVARALLERPDVSLHAFSAIEDVRPELLGMLSEYASGRQLRELAERPETPPSPLITRLRERLTAGADPILSLAEDSGTPPEVLSRLVGTPHDTVIVWHPNVTAHVLDALVSAHAVTYGFFNHWEWLRPVVHAILDMPLATPDVFRRLANVDAQPELRVMLASHPRTPRDVLSHLTEDPHPEVIRTLLNNPNLPAKLRDELEAP